MANINCPANKSPALGNFYDSETVMILKESAVNPSSVFQHASELIIQYKQTDKVFMLLQGDGGFDYNCTTPRSIVANFVIMLELNLEHIVSIRNAGGCSTYNPCERNIGGINFGLQVMACDREESTDEVENAIISSKSIKSFVDKNKKSNPRLINDYMKSVQPCIDKINKTISQCEFAGRKIKIGQIASEEIMDEHISNDRNILPFIPKNVRTCPSHMIFSTKEAKSFFKEHVRVGRYKVETFRNPNHENCAFCNTSNNIMKCKGHLHYPKSLSDESFSSPSELLPIGHDFAETDCPSMNNPKRRGRYFANKNRLNTSTLRALITCFACGIERGLYGSRKFVTEEQIEYFTTEYIINYEWQCGEYLFPNNDPDTVVLPNESWKESKQLLEVRHNITCSSPLEVQVSNIVYI